MEHEEYSRVFTTSFFSMDWSFLLLIVGPVAVLCFMMAAHHRTHPNETFKETVLGFKWHILLLVGVPAAAILQLAVLYSATAGAYQNHAYQTVEGEVSQYQTYAYAGKYFESFSVDGVHFEYGNQTESNFSFCYRKTAGQGGAIRRSGQTVRIGYVVRSGKNCIISLDVGGSSTGPNAEPLRGPSLPVAIFIVCVCTLILRLVNKSGKRPHGSGLFK